MPGILPPAGRSILYGAGRGPALRRKSPDPSKPESGQAAKPQKPPIPFRKSSRYASCKIKFDQPFRSNIDFHIHQTQLRQRSGRQEFLKKNFVTAIDNVSCLNLSCRSSVTSERKNNTAPDNNDTGKR